MAAIVHSRIILLRLLLGDERLREGQGSSRQILTGQGRALSSLVPSRNLLVRVEGAHADAIGQESNLSGGVGVVLVGAQGVQLVGVHLFDTGTTFGVDGVD